MARYRDVPWSLFSRKLPSGKHVWYYYFYENDRRKGPKSTGIGYTAKKDRASSRREASEYLAALFRVGRLSRGSTAPTLDAWVQSVHFFDWSRSRYVRGILARSETDKPGITESYLKVAESAFRVHIKPAHGDIRLDAIDAPLLDDFLFALKRKGLSHKYINNVRSVYSTILAEASRMNVIERNPWSDVQQLKVAPKHRGGLTIAEGKRVLSSEGIERSKRRDVVYHTATRLAFFCGLRIAEVVGLQTDDVKTKTIADNGNEITLYYIDIHQQMNNKTKALSPVKDKEARAVPISEKLYRELDPFIGSGRGRFLFSLDPKGRMPITQNRLREWFNTRLESLEIDRTERSITFHSARRFFNTLLRRNVSDDVVRKLTGHDGTEMTELYTDYLPEDMRKITSVQDGLDEE